MSLLQPVDSAKEDKSDQIRVINHQTSTRQLVHGPKKEVVDICFESVQSNRLACVDSEGTLFIYNIEETNPGKIKYVLLEFVSFYILFPAELVRE